MRLSCALAVLALGVIDAVQALSRRPIMRVAWLSFHVGGSTTRVFRFVLILAALTLFSSIRALLRGKRTAWVLALIAAGSSLAGHHIVRSDIAGVALAGMTIVLLVVSTSHFRARPDPVLARQAIAWLALGLLGTYAYGVTGLYLIDSQFRRATTFTQSLTESARLLFLLPVRTVEPQTRHGHWFIDSVRMLVMVVTFVGVARLLRPALARTHQDQDRERVRSLLERYGDSSLAYFHLLSDKHHMFAEDGQAFIGYKLVGSVAVSLGGPVGTPKSRRAVTLMFLEHCELNGWLPSFHQVTPEAAEELTSFGLKTLKIGEEALVDVKTFSLNTPHFKSIRSKTAKMAREGWTVEELSYPIDEATMARLREISDLWLADGGHRERSFTVGHFDADYLEATGILVCRDPQGAIKGFTNVLPSFVSNLGNFDLMRRDPCERLPVMDFLFVNMIRRFDAAGRQGMTLGLAPFANVTGDSLPDRALRILYERGGRAFNFVGLRDYKQKWLPRWEARFLVYRSDVELPEVALGVSRAGELRNAHTSNIELAGGIIGTTARAMFAAGRRLPFTFAVTSMMLALQAATAFDRDAYESLVSAMHYNWNDLFVHGQIYRLFSAMLLQDGAGFRIGMISMVPLLGLGEYLIGTRRTAVAFIAGDIFSSIPIVFGARLLAMHGWSPAGRFIAERDGGSSSAMYAVIALGALSLTRPKVRRISLALLGIFLIGSAIVQWRIFGLQHIAAALVGVWLWRESTGNVPRAGRQIERREASDRALALSNA
jgi:phosphatidylglycerol lysyltransferase